MKIDSSVIGMASARSYQSSGAYVRRFVIKDYQDHLGGNPSFENAMSGTTVGGERQERENSDQVKTSGEPQNALEELRGRMGIRTGRVGVWRENSGISENLRQVTLRYIFEMLFASRRGKLSDWLEEHGFTDGPVFEASQMEGAQTPEPSARPRTNLRTLSYQQESWYREQENTAFSTVGTVKTSDGREIQFHVDVEMSRSFEEYFSRDLEMADFTLCDPLVINLDVGAAQLRDQKFFFDLDCDGEEDEISMLGSGSGYLALDKNGDGRIGDGSELFGTSSGDGFRDLAQYDGDGNGWIDENDSVWSKLQIWTKDENGQDRLYRLSEKGVGAIYLGSADTDFTLAGQDGATEGRIRRTGIFLYENGAAGTVQHLDVAKYRREA